MRNLTANVVAVLIGLGAWQGSAIAAMRAQAEPQNVSRVAKAINYRHAGTTKVDFQGTALMPQASGEGKVQSRTGRIEVDVKVNGLEEATKFGLEYLTYVLWAVSPQGRAANLGEVVLDHGAGRLRSATELQTFGMIITAEPYFAVTQPSDRIVLENVPRADTVGRAEEIEFSYELLAPGAYASTNERIQDAIFGIDRNTPLELFEARNAVRIARLARADQYAADALSKAEQSLAQAETSYRQKQSRSAVATLARDAAQTAEDARVMSLKKQEQERLQQAAAEREARAKAAAEAEAQRRQRAEEDRAKAEAARAEAERLKAEADAAAQQAAQAKSEADAARAAAVAQQQALAAEADKARQAAAEAERLRQQADKEKSELRARLLQQLNSILETRDSARGLIANMGDVLFETGKYELRPAARERLAKVSGILLAYGGLNVAIEGHTDSVGGDDYNQKLSEQRAEAVRQYFLEQGVAEGALTARGFGKSEPIAANETPEGRQRNRRVELVVSGDAIGAGGNTATHASAPGTAAPVQQ